MSPDIIQAIKDNGIVGAGGAGFPTHVKLNAQAKIVIVNGAECEPLLRVDQQLMEYFSLDVVKGLKIAMSLTGAKKGVIGLKGKYKNAVVNLQKITENDDSVELKIVKDYYPAGDEQQLVFEVTGQVVPQMGIPLDVGVVVVNAQTAINIARGVPVTERVVTINGDVTRPQTLTVPIGVTYRELISACGGPRDEKSHQIIIGGPMMGYVEPDWDAPVTKTTGGIIVLPKHHFLIGKKTRKTETDLNLTKAICCQCSACTDMCPKNIMGLHTQPHKVMRGIANEDASAMGSLASVVSCNNCNLCTMYACPMDLDPGKITTMVKQALLKKGMKTDKIVPEAVDMMRESKKVPTKRLVARLDLVDYDFKAPLVTEIFPADIVKILLKQHIGVVATPLVKQGDQVIKGQMIGTCHDKLGANVHASITGTVTKVTDALIEIRA